MELKLTNDDLRAAISEALLSQIGEPAREELIREALKGVLETKRDNYGRTKTSVLQEAFGQACSRLAHEVVNEIVQSDPEVRAKIEAMAKEAIVKLLSDESLGAVVEAFTSAFTKALRGY